MCLKSKAARLPVWAVAALQLGLASAPAQSAAPESRAAAPMRADPSDPNAPVPAARYHSPLSGYQAFSEPPVAPWRATNDLVRQRGGWRTYAREAREPDAAEPAATAASQPAVTPQPAAAGHPSHDMK
jgi:hypothetical protein